MKQGIKKITHREVKLFKQLANTSISTVEQAKNYCNLNKGRLEKLQNSGYVKLDNVIVKGENVGIMKLDRKGKNYCVNNLGQQFFYRGNLNETVHNLKLTETYYQLEKKFPGMQWQNETYLRKFFPQHLIENKDCVDGICILPNDKGCFAIEVIGAKYTNEKINNKISVGNAIAGRTYIIK